MTTLALAPKTCSFAVWATYVDDPFCPPFVDADRKGGSRGGGGGITARGWLLIAFVVWVAVWAVARLNDYWR